MQFPDQHGHRHDREARITIDLLRHSILRRAFQRERFGIATRFTAFGRLGNERAKRILSATKRGATLAVGTSDLQRYAGRRAEDRLIITGQWETNQIIEGDRFHATASYQSSHRTTSYSRAEDAGRNSIDSAQIRS